VGSLLNFFLSAAPPRSTAERADLPLMKRLHLAALNRGVLIAPRGMMVLATVMDDADVDEALGRIDAALEDLAVEVE
jgi:glutamate-1-semialdehyde aminotransferase